ncbi:RNA helicase [Ceratobasidium sp. 423]|nr:RNA helicase [Ceratobasidium sp. 423]
MSQTTGGVEYDYPLRRDGNNPAPRSSQNKSQLLEATMRNVPKLKELNYTQWKNAITNSIKKAKLWGYIDGSIEEPAEHDSSNLTTYFDEAAAVRGAILGSLESEARRYIEEAFDPRDAWLALEKKYLTAEEETDTRLVSIEQRLAGLRLEEGGDMIEHIAEFCRMRCLLNGTRFALDDQASISMLYRSLPPNLRQSVLTPEGIEMKEFNALCARLSHLSQNPEPEIPIDDTPSAPVEDHTNWGVPEDIRTFGLTGDKNPLLEERAAVTCRDCLLKDHKAGTPECPQYEWRKELWGTEPNEASAESGDSDGSGDFILDFIRKHTSHANACLGNGSLAERPMLINTKRLSYEFSEPVKVILDFDELGLKPSLKQKIPHGKPSAIQQCAILPIIHGRNVLAQASHNNGKTTALVISILQVIDTNLPHVQALVFTSTSEATTAFQKTVNDLGSSLSVQCSSGIFSGANTSSIDGISNHHISVGTPDYLLGLIRRNVINMRKVRIMILDDIDKLIEAGMEDQILEVYRHVPPLAQVVASSTVYSASIAKAVPRLLADPLYILVNRNEGILIGTHFYVKLPAAQKPNALSASFSVLGANGVVLLCRVARLLALGVRSMDIITCENRWDQMNVQMK